MTDLKNKLKLIDPIKLPNDEEFFEQLHSKIMNKVDKIEIKNELKWSKSWIFLEPTAALSVKELPQTQRLSGKSTVS